MRTRHHILHFLPMLPLLVVVLLLAASSCSDKADVPGNGLQDDSRMLYLSFAVDAAPLAEGGTDTDGKYEEGVGLENKIDVDGGDYRIYFFDTDGKYVATFRPYMQTSPTYEPATGNQLTGTYSYRLFGKVPSGVGLGFKLVVLGNWHNYPAEEGSESSWALTKGVTTIEALCAAADAQYTHLSPDEKGVWLRDGSLIPFYGVREYNVRDYVTADRIDADDKLKGETIVDLQKDPVPMLRAVARVEVIINDPLTKVDQVVMDRINAKGFCGPEKALDYTDYVHQKSDGSWWDWDNDFIRGVHLVGGANDAAPQSLAFTQVSDNRWLTYVPEYRNKGVGEGFCSIKLKNSETNSESTLYFANYVDGKTDNTNRLDIERNNIYRFTIAGSFATPTVEVDIQPYAECRLTYDFGLMRDERGDLMVVFDDEGNLPAFFAAYLDEHPNMRPKVLDDDGKETDELLDLQKGDYYAIIRSAEGGISEVWIKDADECRVITNFVYRTDNNDDCSTRKVWEFQVGTGITEQVKEGHKDRDGDWRLQHNADHSSVVYDVNGQMIFKSDLDSTDGKRYLVESWDEKTGIFWYEKSRTTPYQKEDGKTYITYTYQEADKTGKDTNTPPKEIEEEYIVEKSENE